MNKNETGLFNAEELETFSIINEIDMCNLENSDIMNMTEAHYDAR